MKKPMSTRQMKRKFGINMQDVFSLYDQFTEEVGTLEGNVAKKKGLGEQPVDVNQLLSELELNKSSLKVKDVVGMLKGKMKTLDEKMFELKQANEVVKFANKPIVSVKVYSEKAHD